MKKMTSDEIRDTWLKFFREREHYVEPSANLIPVDDPSLLWINSGVAALKKYFDGSERPPHRRIVNAQKSIRTNDIENVGHTARHHTFFEMLGNFSIGDYFREEVIPWAAELLMSDSWFGLPAEKLYVTYHPSDVATRDLWIRSGIAADHLIPLEGNFWEIGEGPCGPDTEIFFDRGPEYDPDKRGVSLLIDEIDNDRYIEIWNIVFSQYNAVPGKPRSAYRELPQKNIDTGAGLERLACIMQQTETNYETDLFRPLISAIEKVADHPYEGEWKLAYRVIADHIRSVAFALADGAVFANDGRGYVLRRLVRRAARYAGSLGLQTGFLSTLAPVVAGAMAHFYPYLSEKSAKVSRTIRGEEEKFAATLKAGESMLQAYLDQSGDTLSGADAFRLFDTYGFPLELTVEIAAERGKKVDLAGYDEAMSAQKERARQARGQRFSMGRQSADLLEFVEPSTYTYEEKPLEARVIGVFKDGVKVEEIGEEGEVIFDVTDFYAESGGQVSDCGRIENAKTEAEVVSVVKAPNKQHLHKIKVVYGTVKVGDTFSLEPDLRRRRSVKKNHSATHLLQRALQELVSPDIRQAGSSVSADALHFDFNLERRLSSEELAAVERRVNEIIFEALPRRTEIMEKNAALKTGAMSLFGEKYDDTVRVVSFGDYSKEFCAGTHVDNTADIQSFAVVSEEAVAAGIRRLTAVTGLAAYRYFAEKRALLNDIAGSLSLRSEREIMARLKSMQTEREASQERIAALESQVTSGALRQLLSAAVDLGDYNFYSARLDGFTHNQLASLLKQIVAEDGRAVCFVASRGSSKFEIGVAVGSALDFKAGSIVKELGRILGGSGGGKPDMAFGGAPVEADLAKAEEYLRRLGQ